MFGSDMYSVFTQIPACWLARCWVTVMQCGDWLTVESKTGCSPVQLMGQSSCGTLRRSPHVSAHLTQTEVSAMHLLCGFLVINWRVGSSLSLFPAFQIMVFPHRLILMGVIQLIWWHPITQEMLLFMIWRHHNPSWYSPHRERVVRSFFKNKCEESTL